jgi:hypothetical protein
MPDNNERRTEPRLRYCWPVWFAENTNCDLSQGQMVDVSSKSAAFTCYNDYGHQYVGQPIVSRFSVPRYGPDNSFELANFTRTGQICRIDQINPFMQRIAFRFHQPLPFKPGERIAENACV